MREKSSSEDLKSRRTGFTRTTKTASSVVGAVAVAFIVILVCLTIGAAQSNAPHPTSGALTALTQTSPSVGTPQFSYGLTSPHAQTDGFFGSSVAISGTTVVVGAPAEPAGEAGHAYIFNTKTGLLRLLTSPNAQAFGSFGASVAISGATVVVGAPGETFSYLDAAGHAYIFNATTGGLISTLISPNAQYSGEFGHSVAISGTTVVVGAWGETASGDSEAGHAYTFSASTGDLISTLTSPNAQTDGEFGASVAISGATVVVGTAYETASGDSDAGHAYTFSATTGDLISTLTSPNTQTDGEFGWSVAISGTTVMVGAPQETASGYEEAGYAYTFSATTGDLISTLTSPRAQIDGAFGASVAVNGTTVVVGAPGEKASGDKYAGRAYAFNATTRDLISTLISLNAQTDGSFGTPVAISGTTIVIGALYETASGHHHAGHCYVFGTMPLGITSPNAQTEGEFGGSVAISGTTVVVGASSETASGDTYAGHAYIVNTKTGVVTVLTSPNAQKDGGFGTSVAISGTTVVVGAPGENASGHSKAGHAYTFNATTGALIDSLTSPKAQTDGYFGRSAAVSGNTIVVGADGEGVHGYKEAGHAYTFNATSGKVIVTLTSPNAQKFGIFGYSVGINGTTVVVGAPEENASGLSDAGHAYTFNAKTGALVSTVTSPNAQTDGSFGISVAISGTTVVVGAWGETALGYADAGHAYTFNAKTGALTSTLTSPNAQTDGSFGVSVGISGTTVVVGASWETASGYVRAGLVYAFSATTGALIVSLTSPNAQEYGYFGSSVAASGTMVVVGAPTETASGYADAGHAYLC